MAVVCDAPAAHPMIDHGQLHRDGYLLLRGAIPADWLEPLRAAFDAGETEDWPVPRGRDWRHSLLDLDPTVQALCRLPPVLAAAGILLGLLVWGVFVSIGLGVLLLSSALAFGVLKTLGAAYLVYLGVRMMVKPREGLETEAPRSAASSRGWLLRGLLTNLLNPKVGVFYLSFLPQFVPATANLALGSFLLACVHVALSLGWFALIIGATASVGRLLRRPGAIRWLDRGTGLVLVGFGLRLAASSRS